MDVVAGGISPVRDLGRLLQDMDINRLRAVVFRDIVSRGIPSFLLADMYFLPAPKYGEYKHVVI